MDWEHVKSNLIEYYIRFSDTHPEFAGRTITLGKWVPFFLKDDPFEFMMVPGELIEGTWWLKIYKNGDCFLKDHQTGWKELGTLHKIEPRTKTTKGSA